MSYPLWFVLPAIVAAGISFALTPLISRLAVRIGAIDEPGHRKLHSRPIPRLGGLSVVVAIGAVLSALPWLAGGFWGLPSHLGAGMALGLLPVLVVSLIDDIRSVGAWPKLFAHVAGAVAAVAFGISLGPVVHLFGTPIYIGFMAAPLSVLWIVGATNAFNIIDGLDGLSAGLALIAASSMAALFFVVGHAEMAGVVLVLAGALAGFLPHNVHPAKLFLGDTGATFIGFCLAAFALKGGSTLSSGFAVLLPVFMLGLPIADTLITMARRFLGRFEKPGAGVFVADRNHIHHRLLALGVNHRNAVLLLYGAGLVLGAAAFVSVFLSAREAGFFVLALVVAGLVGVHRLGYDEFAFVRRGVVHKLYDFPVLERGLFVVFLDILLSIVVAYLTVGVKFDDWSFPPAVMRLAAAFAPVSVAVFWLEGIYRGSWRVAGIPDLTRIFKAVAISTGFGALVIEFGLAESQPVSMYVIYGFLTLVVTAFVRSSYVILEDSRLRLAHAGTPVLIYGAGERGASTARELFLHPSLRPIGFIDDDVRKRGKLVSDLPVFGTERELRGILRSTDAGGLLIAAEAIPAERLQRLAETCEEAGVSIYRATWSVEQLTRHEGDAPRPSLSIPTRLELAGAGCSTVYEKRPVRRGPRGPLECPSCSGRELHRSKARSNIEILRRRLSAKRVFRCHDCGWRGWLLPLDRLEGTMGPASPDLTSLDGTLATRWSESPDVVRDRAALN